MAVRVVNAVRAVAAGTVAAVVLLGCGVRPDPGGLQPSPALPPSISPTMTSPAAATTGAAASPTPELAAGYGATPRPGWLGTRVLPERSDGLGEIQRTPPELADRRLPPMGMEPVGGRFAATVGPVPLDVVARSTWTADCPVSLDELRYISVPFLGFDGHTYAGEMILHADVAADVASVFERLYEAEFPIEEMKVVAPDELDAPPTGDGNNTTAFVCRSTTLGGSWSEHAYGLAVDINPFHNPYARGDAVIPELATAYLDRDRDRPGMIHAGDAVTTAFAEIGWAWGGEWGSLKDWMHFSRSGR